MHRSAPSSSDQLNKQPRGELSADTSITAGALDILPNHLIVNILGFTDAATVLAAAQTCRRLLSIASTHSLWNHLCLQRFPHHLLPSTDDINDTVDSTSWREVYRSHIQVSINQQRGNCMAIALPGPLTTPVVCLQMDARHIYASSLRELKQYDVASYHLADGFATGGSSVIASFRLIDGRLYINGTETIRVFDAESKEFIFKLDGVPNQITAFDVHGDCIVTGGWDGCVAVPFPIPFKAQPAILLAVTCTSGATERSTWPCTPTPVPLTASRASETQWHRVGATSLCGYGAFLPGS